MRVNLIVAVSGNGVIGCDGKMPWSIPADLKYFREKTEGYPIIMGRKTFESIGKPLANRVNVVISRDKNRFSRGCVNVDCIYDAIKYSLDAGWSECFIIGGAEIYKQALELGVVDRCYVTEIYKDYEGDAFFDIDVVRCGFTLVEITAMMDVVSDSHEGAGVTAYSFCVYDKKA